MRLIRSILLMALALPVSAAPPLPLPPPPLTGLPDACTMMGDMAEAYVEARDQGISYDELWPIVQRQRAARPTRSALEARLDELEHANLWLIYDVPLMTPEGNRSHMEQVCRREMARDVERTDETILQGRE